MNVLFVCVHNSGRSQMAEAIFNREAARRGLDARAKSAGTMAGGEINPRARDVLGEMGIGSDGLHPKTITPAMVEEANLIVGMGCGVDGEACPTRFLLGEDWGLEDPAGQPIEVVREIGHEVAKRVGELLDRIERDGGP